MLTIVDVRNKVNAFPEDEPVEELLNELMLLYKIQRGLQEAEDGEGLSLDEYNKEMQGWWKSL